MILSPEEHYQESDYGSADMSEVGYAATEQGKACES